MKGGFGPGFQDARSGLYRAEYAAITLAVLSYLVWRTVHGGGVDWLQVAFWACSRTSPRSCPSGPR